MKQILQKWIDGDFPKDKAFVDLGENSDDKETETNQNSCNPKLLISGQGQLHDIERFLKFMYALPLSRRICAFVFVFWHGES